MSENILQSKQFPKISSCEQNILVMLLNFDSLEIPYTIDFYPDQQLKFVVSGKDRFGVAHAAANTDLAVALDDLFQLLRRADRIVEQARQTSPQG